MARKILRFLGRLDDLLELACVSTFRFFVSRRGALLAALLAGAVGYVWWHQPPEQKLEPGALVPALAVNDLDREISDLQLDDTPLVPPRPVQISVDAIVGRHGDHSALITYDGRSYRARPGTLLPPDGPPSFVVTRVSCNSVEAYDWQSRRSITASWQPEQMPELDEVTE